MASQIIVGGGTPSNILRNARFPTGNILPTQAQVFGVTTQAAGRRSRTSSTQREAAFRSRQAQIRVGRAASSQSIVMM